MSDIQAGDVVVCVDASPSRAPYHVKRDPTVPLTLGAYYRVRELAPAENGRIGIRLVGIILPHYERLGTEIVFKADRFRKIDAADEQFTHQIRSLKPVRENA
jgi:hypothetical protein